VSVVVNEVLDSLLTIFVFFLIFIHEDGTVGLDQ